jgi:hypothetical protein
MMTIAGNSYRGDLAVPDFALVLLYLLPPSVRNRSMLIPLLVGTGNGLLETPSC